MSLDLNTIKKEFSDYHIQVAQVLSGMDAELESQKKDLARFKTLEIEILKLMGRMERLEASIEQLSQKP